MENFEFHAPTKIIFGKDTHKQVGEVISSYGYKKVLLHYGGGSVKKNGLYESIVASLNDSKIDFVELAGVQPNPKLSLVKKGVQICKSQGIELVLAVGGGSVLDSAKVIATGALYDCDPWEFSAKITTPTMALPVGAVLTLSASGSEMSTSAVITNEENLLKRGYNSEFNKPLFSICNPELTYSVDKYQTACGIVDIMMHTLERYFTLSESDVELTDRLAEGLIKTVINAGTKALDNPNDYGARANLMWAGSLSHNDLMGAGRKVFMACHHLEHELSGMYDFVAHGAGLSVVFIAWAKYLYKYSIPRFCQYATRIWNIEMDYQNPEKTALAGILATERFFSDIGMPIRLSEFNIGGDKIAEMAQKCTFWGKRTLPDYIELGQKEIEDIFKLGL